MSKTSRNFQQVSEHFRCPIHLGKLRDPRRLPCEHTLCAECLKNLIKSSLKRESNLGTFECPECRGKHHIPQTETEDWADWFPVDAFCVIQLQTLDKFKESQVCEVHPDKFKEYFCFHHQELYCPDCIISQHTSAPCYARNCSDAVGDIKKHVADLLGQLRLQEQQAVRIGCSTVAASHTEDLMQKVWEVEHMIDRFHKQMKRKLNDARIQIEHATKITQADKDHLKTTHQLITQTKTLVDDKLHNVNVKSREGQLDILRIWKPLQEQVNHFQTVLTAVEKRPFCVSIQPDDPFLQQLSLDHEPVLVQNESSIWTPLNPTIVHRSPSASSFRSKANQKRKKAAFKEPPIPSTLATSRSKGADTSFPRSRSGYRTVTTVTKPTADSVNIEYERLHLSTKQDRSPTILPRLTAGGLTGGQTSKVFNIRSLKLKGISQQSVFEFPCEDIIVMENNIITISERAVQKFSLRYQFIESIFLRSPIKLCYTRDDTNSVLVLDSGSGISLISTQPRLKLIYRVNTDRGYSGLCHMRTSMTENAYGECQYHMHLALMHVWNKEDCIDVMVVTYKKLQMTFGLVEEINLSPAKVKTINGSNDDPSLKHMTSLCTAPDNRNLLIGSQHGVVCMNRTGDTIWTFPTSNVVCSVESRRGLIYAVIEINKQVLILDQQGNQLVENLLPVGCTVSRPCRVSVGKTSMIVREFTDREPDRLKSIVHVFNLSFS